MSRRGVLDAFDRALAPALRYLTAAVVLALMAVTCIDVLGRYLLNKPLTGGLELTELLLAATIFAALPLVTRRGEHVSVDLFDAITPRWLQRVQEFVAAAVGCACTAYVGWRLWLRAGQMVDAGETTAQLKIGLGVVTYGMSVLMGITALAFLVFALRGAVRGAHEESPV